MKSFDTSMHKAIIWDMFDPYLNVGPDFLVATLSHFKPSKIPIDLHKGPYEVSEICGGESFYGPQIISPSIHKARAQDNLFRSARLLLVIPSTSTDKHRQLEVLSDRAPTKAPGILYQDAQFMSFLSALNHESTSSWRRPYCTLMCALPMVAWESFVFTKALPILPHAEKLAKYGPRQGARKYIEYKCKNCCTQSGADAAEQQAYRDSCKVHSVPGVPGRPAAGTRVRPPQVAARVPLPQSNVPLHASAPNPPLQQPQLGRGHGVPVARGRGGTPAACDRHPVLKITRYKTSIYKTPPSHTFWNPVHSKQTRYIPPMCRFSHQRRHLPYWNVPGHVSDAPFSIFSSATTTPTSLRPRHIESASKCAPMPTEIQMSLKTGILSNTNNELSHRMARNNQRQSAAARRAREAHEKAAKAPSGNRGKSRATAVVLSASSSGCVRTTRPRTNAPAQPAQSESNNSLTPTVVKTTTTQVEEPPMAANSVQPPVDPAFFDFDFDSLLASLETCPSIFAQDTSNTGNNAPTTDPLDEFMTMYGFSDIMSSDGAASSFVSGAPFNNELPLLPPPPPESPPAPSPTVEHPSESVPRSRCARKEVDEANIIYSTRSRAPTARKRFADEQLSDRPTKKRRASKRHKVEMAANVFTLSISCRHISRWREICPRSMPGPGQATLAGTSRPRECAVFPAKSGTCAANVPGLSRMYRVNHGMDRE
ncbi:hypothetical protein B0H13DRAFT_1874401 [Mycena leptocephala]|nr:hypothetical protein B0H13DRAFT_1874401 [Mycena leptocephala]